MQLLKIRFPKISDSKIKEGVIVGPKIRALIQDVIFEDQLYEVEKAAWNLFRNTTTIFLGNYKAEKYRIIVADLVQSYKAMGFNVSFEGLFLDLHSDIFPKNLQALGDGHENDFTRILPPLKSGTKESGAPVCWLVVVALLELTFHRQNIEESYPLSHLSNVYTVCNIM
jgi:hypothetical protein